MNRIARLAAVAVLGVGLAVAAPASPAAAAACPDAGGVTVVVDFAGLGGGVAMRCAPGDPATGVAALTGAGFDWEYWVRQPGLVCRIDGLPDPCNGAPEDAHWSYWHAERGGSWQFSTRGAGTYDPEPGTVEGWAFGAADQPGVPPPAPPAPPPPPDDDPPADDPPDHQDPPADDPPTDEGDDAPGDRDPSAGGDDQPGDRSPAGEPSAGASTGPPSPGAPGPTATGVAAPAPAVPGDPAARTTDEAGGAGGLAGLLVTATLVGALAAVGIWTAHRRRRGARAADDEPATDAAADG